MKLKLKNQNMAAFKAVAFQSLACVWFCVSAAAAVQNCSLVNCKVLPVGENIASEFRLKASEKGVRMIYLNLKIGNNSYNPLQLQDEFQPDRWVWARSNKEPMLSLQYDYDILSLGLLNYQVRSMTVPLRDEPSGCLAGLNSTCQNMAVGRALLDNVTMESNSGVVCVAMIKKIVREHNDARSIRYHCCRLNASSINCDVPVEGSSWYQAIENFLIYLAVVLVFYSPALLLLLPDYIFDLQYECDKEGNTDELTYSLEEVDSISIHARNGYEEIPDIHNVKEDRLKSSVLREIPVDDASPVTCSTALLGCVQRLPDVKMSFNLKLAVLLFCIFPFGFYLNVGLLFVLREKYLDEFFMKFPLGTSVLETPIFFSINIFYPTSPFPYFLLALLTLTCLMAVLFLRPKDLFLNQNFLYRQRLSTKHFFSLPITENEDSVSIGAKMLHHLYIIPELPYLLMFKFLNQYKSGLQKLGNISTCYLKVNHNGSRIRRALFTLWILFSSLVTLFLASLVWVVIASFFFSVSLLFNLFLFSPFLTLFMISVINFASKVTKVFNFTVDFTSILSKFLLGLFTIFTGLYFFLILFSAFLPVFMLCSFFVGILGFTIMGLVLNVETVTPYAAFFVVVVTNIYFCYANLQKSYMEVKGFILKYWQQEMQAALNSEHSTIPAKLFWFVSDKVFPVKTEICLMLSKVAVIVTFLFLTISSIIFFKNEYEISTLVSTIAVFLSGAIPSLFFKGLTKGKRFTGWRKIKLKKKIEAVVTEYVQETNFVDVNRETEEGSSVV